MNISIRMRMTSWARMWFSFFACDEPLPVKSLVKINFGCRGNDQASSRKILHGMGYCIFDRILRYNGRLIIAILREKKSILGMCMVSFRSSPFFCFKSASSADSKSYANNDSIINIIPTFWVGFYHCTLLLGYVSLWWHNLVYGLCNFRYHTRGFTALVIYIYIWTVLHIRMRLTSWARIRFCFKETSWSLGCVLSIFTLWDNNVIMSDNWSERRSHK